MTIPKAVAELIERYERNRDSYESAHYNETQLRREFIDPTFEAFGWDVNNRKGYAEAYKHVVHEDSLLVEGISRSPDYSFRVGGVRKFFLETKKPSLNLKDDPDAAFQLRRYAWSAKLPLSILSSFAEWSVYDTRVRPHLGDKSSVARVLYIPVEELTARWDELESLFSLDALQKGEFDRYSQDSGRKRGTTAVDDAFLEELEEWRTALARNIALRNATLDGRELNTAVQLTIDRIVFLRICEDRGLEPWGDLMTLLNGANTYSRLLDLFTKADARYNSGLFHFRKEKNREELPDTLTPRLKIDDKPLKSIVARLYPPESPYAFGVIPAEILGHIYERFLGSVITLSPGHHATVVPKPEVKKAGGVFYTPTFIVDFIVRETLSKLCEGKNLKTVRDIRVVDPACGSGSFLLAVYQFFLDWHHALYMSEKPDEWTIGKTPRLHQTDRGGYRLTTAERKRILKTHVYGVDIDAQAVEVTKLSLLLRVLEGETAQSIQAEFTDFRERALPDLSDNIKCGNSLVGPDVADSQQTGLFDEEATDRINAFDWKKEFHEATARGGFDAVVGNPPYAYRNATEEGLRPYYLEHYSVAEGNFDLYKFFMERSLSLVRPKGRVGLVVSASFLVQPSFTKLRTLIANKATIESLAPLGPNAFPTATVDTTVIILESGKPSTKHSLAVRAPRVPTDLASAPSYSIAQARFRANESFVFDYRLSDEGANLLDKLLGKFPNVEKGFEFGVGINTGFIRADLVADRRKDSRYHPMVPGSGISRYGMVKTVGWIMYDAGYVRSRGKEGRTLPAEHLLSSPKILVVRTRNLSLERRVIATIDEDGGYNLNRLTNIVARDGYSLDGLLGILNSKLFDWMFSTRFFDYEIKPVYLRSCPLADCNDKTLIALSRRMRKLVTAVELPATSAKRERLAKLAERVNSQIDDRVYRLYGLSTAERALVDAGVPAFAREIQKPAEDEDEE